MQITDENQKKTQFFSTCFWLSSFDVRTLWNRTELTEKNDEDKEARKGRNFVDGQKFLVFRHEAPVLIKKLGEATNLTSNLKPS